MTKLYFGDTTTIATTIMILALVVFIGCTVVDRGSVQHWGVRGCYSLRSALSSAVSRRRATGWTRPSSPPSTGAARPGCSRWPVSRPLWGASAPLS